MKSRLFWALGWATMGSLAALQGCGGDDDDGGDGGGGGSAGKATGGSSGKATGGTAGKGTGGSAGKATGGTAGKATGGAAGTATGGSGGEMGGAGGEGGSVSEDRAAVCEEYCDAYYEIGCNTATTANTYTDEPNCRNVCNAADWPLGERGDAAGDTLHCRVSHVGLASMGNTAVHCGHASENSTGVCVD
jgi:hypothetical protein